MPNHLIISDASPIIALEDIGELSILKKLYERVIITEIVKDEIDVELPSWIEVNNQYNSQQFSILELELDQGEASAIALALNHPNSKIILDEKKGRTIAKRLGVKIIGTLGIIIKAKEDGIISSGKSILEKLEVHGFWLSAKLKKDMLKKLGE